MSPSPRISRRSLAALFSAALLVGGLAACSSDDPGASNTTPATVTPTPSKTLTAEEAAYAAAEDAYRDYQKFEDTMQQNGGKYNDDDLWKYASGEMRPFFISLANSFLKANSHTEGSTDIRWIDDVSYNKKTANVEEIKLIACLSKQNIVYISERNETGTYATKMFVYEVTLQNVDSKSSWRVSDMKEAKSDKACS